MGFAQKKWTTVQKIRPGDQLLCYMIKQKCFFAVLKVTGNAFWSTDKIWDDEVYPARLKVKIVLQRNADQKVPVISLMGKLSYLTDETWKSWGVHFRGLPKQESDSDAETIVNALRKGVSAIDPLPQKYSHEQIQWLLLSLGAAMRLSVWVAKNDRSRSYEGQSFSNLSGLRRTLPIQFDLKTQGIIEHIDVLWLKGNSIVAAFEIEHTTSIYSGLLRMSDLITLQPNLSINLFLVAPDDRKDKVRSEINRPTFASAKLPGMCRYIAYSKLTTKIDQAKSGGFLHHLSPSFLNEISEDMKQ